MNANSVMIVIVLATGMTVPVPNLLTACAAEVSQTADAQAAIAKRIGVIKAISANSIALSADSGPEVAVTVQADARLLRLEPGQRDLKSATVVQLQDLQVGDTIRVRGTASDDGKSIAALEILVLTRSAVAAVSDRISQDWQKRGLAGPVSAVNAAQGTVTISTSGFGSGKAITVHAAKNTIVRRYAPDSAKFEDAKVSSLQEVQVGDQLRARGTRSADGSELTAEEIVAGTFPRIAGLIKTVDASAGILSVQDLTSKKTVQLKITADSQLHKIPAEMAQRFAMRVKAALPAGVPGASASPSGAEGKAAPGDSSSATRSQGGGSRGGGGFDFQRLLDQTPAVAPSDLHKEDAVLVLATQGTPAGGSTVLKLFSGVEPIFQAAPNGSQAMMLAPWTLGGGPGDAAAQ